MITTIRVTKALIEEGVAADCHKCPIALAIAMVVQPQIRVVVANHYARLFAGSGRLASLELPDEAAKFIRVFDAWDSRIPQPFEFELDIPQEVLR